MYTFPGQPGETLSKNTFFLYLSMLRYYVIGVYKAINNITVIAQSNYNLKGYYGGLTSSIPNRVVTACADGCSYVESMSFF
jgi:hypothetical protein